MKMNKLLLFLFFLMAWVSGYSQTMTLTSISPSSGASGNSVTLTGTNLANTINVFFGTSASIVQSVSSTVIVTTAPNLSSGTYCVYASTGRINSNCLNFTYGPTATPTNTMTPTGTLTPTNTPSSPVIGPGSVSQSIHTWVGISVKEAPYNAVGNGIANDLAAIQTAQNAVSLAGGGDLIFPPGTYTYSGAAVTFGGKNVHWQGTQGKSILQRTDSTDSLVFSNSVSCRISDMTFYSTSSTESDQSVLYANTVTINNLIIERTTVSNPNSDSDGLQMTSASNIAGQFYGIYLNECNFTNIGRIGVEFHNSSGSQTNLSMGNIHVVKCNAFSCGTVDATNGFGYSFSGGSNDSGLWVDSCAVSNCLTYGIETMFNQQHIINNTLIDGISSGGTTPYGIVSSPTFQLNTAWYSGNQFPDTTWQYAMVIYNNSNATLTGNDAVGQGALYLRNAVNLVSAGNIWDATVHGALFTDVANTNANFSGDTFLTTRTSSGNGVIVFGMNGASGVNINGGWLYATSPNTFLAYVGRGTTANITAFENGTPYSNVALSTTAPMTTWGNYVLCNGNFTFTPTPTCNAASTPGCANQFTPTPTFTPTGTLTPTVTPTPTPTCIVLTAP